MKIITPSLHAILDYLVVVFLWVSPSLFNFSENVSMFTYALGAVHLLLTIFTNFKGGLIKIIPLRIHGHIEVLVSILVIILAWAIPSLNNTDRYFYTGFGIAVFLTWLLTDYNNYHHPVPSV